MSSTPVAGQRAGDDYPAVSGGPRHVAALLGDPKYLGAQPGIIAALHTWSQTLVLHLHVHCLVTGVG